MIRVPYVAWHAEQVWNAVDPEDEVLAMVCRTGLNTQVGSMVRQLATPSKLANQKDPFIRVSPPLPPLPIADSFSFAKSTSSPSSQPPCNIAALTCLAPLQAGPQRIPICTSVKPTSCCLISILNPSRPSLRHAALPCPALPCPALPFCKLAR